MVVDEKYNEVDEKDKRPIELMTCKLKYNWSIGSHDSMNFHQALSKSSMTTIFSTAAIHGLVAYKWNQLQKFAIIQALVYLKFLFIV